MYARVRGLPHDGFRRVAHVLAGIGKGEDTVDMTRETSGEREREVREKPALKRLRGVDGKGQRHIGTEFLALDLSSDPFATPVVGRAE